MGRGATTTSMEIDGIEVLSEDPEVRFYVPPRTVTYERRRILIRGWRMPLDVMTNWDPEMPVPDGCLLPGYVHGVPGESSPIKTLPPARCTCIQRSVTAAMLRFSGLRPIQSACHLDHCRVHGPFRETR